MSVDLAHVRFEGRPTLRPARPWSARRPRAAERSAPDAGVEGPDVAGGVPALVLSLAGLDPASYRPKPLERRLAACLRALRVESEPAARARLDERPELRVAALSALLIGVSGFFRDAPVVETLRRVVVPALRNRPGPIRIWSAGCSTGAELYSLGILLGEAGCLDRVRLLGTDCRIDAIARARAGVFADEALGDVDADLRRRWFERVPAGWRVAEALRRATRWQVADVTRETAPGSWDVVLCRNVAIYLHAAVVEGMYRRIAGTLVPGGFLIVGKAERPPAALCLAAAGRCVHRSHGAA